MRKYLIIIPVLLLVYFLTLKDIDLEEKKDGDTLSLKDNTSDFQEKEENLVSVSYNGDNLKMSIDEYVIHVLACEMPASFNVEALKAGAVAARTFYLYKIEHNPNYIATTSDQCFNNEADMKKKWNESYDKFYNIIKNSVLETAGEYISYDGDVIQAFYFSLSNGYTENVENVFSESKPYLVGVKSSWDKEISGYEKSVTFTKKDFLSKLGLSESENINFEIVSMSSTGRINEIIINGIKIKGTEFRAKLNLRSTDFDINLQDDKIVINTRGYGHGVGLSQYGANEMAKLGYSYKDILKYYYSGVEISTI